MIARWAVVRGLGGVGAALAVGMQTASAGKPSGGGGGGSVDTGVVYYDVQGAPWTMNPDGSAKTLMSLPAGWRHEPSRALHGGHRWFLGFSATPGEFHPDGNQRYDLRAIRDDGAIVTRLTSAPDLIVIGSWEHRWSPGDAAVSWRGERWVDGVKVDRGIYVAGVVFDGSGNVTGLVSQPTGASVPGGSSGGHDWAPDGVRLVHAEPDRTLWVSNLSSGVSTRLNSPSGGDKPAWSPDGSTIAYGNTGTVGGGIRTISPDGSGDRSLVMISPKNDVSKSLSYPAWSPNGTHLVYLQFSPSLSSRWDIYRVTAGGSAKTNLTADAATGALWIPRAWR